MHYWPEVVPHELVVRLAELGSASELRPVVDRLFPAVAAVFRREIAQAEVDSAVADLWSAVSGVEP
ncbi:hypothetical protein ACL02R_29255 [Streptomyces sp. MS19]|uniref:hypothetical protein n=1 Tax=Streptomyces sp. MS19 TaxID=3385972 RepID=UPI0039A3B52A